jgi:hypothetical protein
VLFIDLQNQIDARMLVYAYVLLSEWRLWEVEVRCGEQDFCIETRALGASAGRGEYLLVS